MNLFFAINRMKNGKHWFEWSSILSKDDSHFVGRDERRSHIRSGHNEDNPTALSAESVRVHPKRCSTWPHLRRTVTIGRPRHVSSISPFLHVIQGGVWRWTDPNRASLHTPSGLLVCTKGREGQGVRAGRKTVVSNNLPLWGIEWVQTVGLSALEAQPHNPVCLNVKTNNVTARLICSFSSGEIELSLMS